MANIRQRGTAPELAVREVASSLGIRYRLHNRDLPGSPDLANRTQKWAVFVHGCFWHRHHGCSKTTSPTRNADFWEEKFQANIRRDRRVTAALRKSGHRVIVIWECKTTSVERVRKSLSPLVVE